MCLRGFDLLKFRAFGWRSAVGSQKSNFNNLTINSLTIDIKKVDEEFLNISIIDDGIGCEKTAELIIPF